MPTTESELADPEVGCASAVDELLARHGWQLLDRREFVRRTLEQFRAGIATDARRAATYVYSQALHAACSGAQGPVRRERGYYELFRYLYDGAYYRYPDVRDDAAQAAIERVFRSFERCRQPGAFLAFALQQLRDAVRAIRRQEYASVVALDEPVSVEQEPRGAFVADPVQRDPVELVSAGELHRRVQEFAEQFRKKHPRARLQLDAVLLKYIEGLDDEAISQRLGKPINSIHVLRSRAVKKLREDPDWQALAVEFGLDVEVG